MVWQRPNNVEFPRTWLKFSSFRDDNLKFVIRDLSAEHYDICLGYLTNMLLRESAISGPLNVIADDRARCEMQQIFIDIMKSNTAMVCLTVDEELPRVAGVHVTMVRERQGTKHEKTAETLSKFSRIVDELKNAGELFNRFNADYYLGSLGLLVLPEFRGHGVATHILKARLLMCEALGLAGTASVFSTAGAQAAAASAGYQVFAESKVEEVWRRHGVTIAHDLKVMGKSV